MAVYSYPKKRRVVKKLKQNQKGFTLIELLVVIAIIGLLASVVLLALNSARQKSRDAKRLADVRQIASALELYYDTNGGYPTSANFTTTGGASSLAPTFLGSIPTNPTPATDGTCTNSTGAYTYTGGAFPATSYSLTFCLGAATGGITAGAHTLSQAGIN